MEEEPSTSTPSTAIAQRPAAPAAAVLPPPPPPPTPSPSAVRAAPQQPPARQDRRQQQDGPQQGPARKQRASSSSVQLNKEVMATGSTAELLSLVRAKGSQMDYFNLSSAIAKTPKLAGLQGGNDVPTSGLSAHAPHHALDRDSHELAGCLAHLMCGKMHMFDARGLANSAWAFGKMRLVPCPALPSMIAGEAVKKMAAFSAQVRAAEGGLKMGGEGGFHCAGWGPCRVSCRGEAPVGIVRQVAASPHRRLKPTLHRAEHLQPRLGVRLHALPR